MRILDGANDGLDEGHGFQEASERYRATADSGVVTAAKSAIIEVLQGTTDLRASLRLGKFLHWFKCAYQDTDGPKRRAIFNRAIFSRVRTRTLHGAIKFCLVVLGYTYAFEDSTDR